MKLIKDNLFLILFLATLLFLFFIQRTTSKELISPGKLINNPNKTFYFKFIGYDFLISENIDDLDNVDGTIQYLKEKKKIQIIFNDIISKEKKKQIIKFFNDYINTYDKKFFNNTIIETKTKSRYLSLRGNLKSEL